VLRAALNARFSFFPAALTPLVENLSVLAIVIAFGRTLGVTAIAVGYLTGGVAQLLYVASAAARRGLRLRPRWGLSDEAVRGGLRLVLLPIGTTGLSMGARAVERFLASFLPAGSITILNYAWVVVNSVGGAVFFRSVVVALLPSLAEAREPRARRRILAQGTRIMTLVSFPLTALVAVLALPLVSLAFQRGAFTRSSAELLASLLAIYALQLPLNALTRVFLSHFYARLDMVTPFLNGAIGVGIDVVLAVALFRPLGVRGLAVAYGVGAVGNIVHAYVRVRRETPFRITSEVAYMAKVAFAALLAGTIAFAAMMLVPAGGGLVARTVRLAVPGALALVGFVVALVVARAHRVSDVVAVLRHDRGKHRPGRHAARRVG
jgi:putative peptidoglycan lipid II flippase